MVIQNIPQKTTTLKQIEDEISILYSLGVGDDEVKYLISLKARRINDVE